MQNMHIVQIMHIYIKYAILHMNGLNCIFAVSLLNLTEEVRSKPENWIPVGWIPIYRNELSKRPSSGYESDSARYHRLMHDCLRSCLEDWDAKTQHTVNIVYGDDVCRQTRVFLGGLLCDQQVCILFIFDIYCILHIFDILCIFQECDVFTCEPAPACHRCTVTKGELLSTALFSSETTTSRKEAILKAASGQDRFVRGVQTGEPVVQWKEDGSDTAPGPKAAHYESAKKLALICCIMPFGL